MGEGRGIPKEKKDRENKRKIGLGKSAKVVLPEKRKDSLKNVVKGHPRKVGHKGHNGIRNRSLCRQFGGERGQSEKNHNIKTGKKSQTLTPDREKKKPGLLLVGEDGLRTIVRRTEMKFIYAQGGKGEGGPPALI